MGAYNVTIIDDALVDVLTLKKIISGFCININSISHVLSIDEGVEEVSRNKPDIVFMDVMFQDSVIFDSLDRFSLENVPIIFLSSERGFAVNAFESNAVGFILKPFKVENVIFAINQAIKSIELNSSSVGSRSDNFDYLAISSLDKIDFIKKDDVVFCMAEGKYTTFFLLGGRKIVSSKNLGEYEKVLGNTCFYRIHHGYIINIKYLISVIKKDGVYCELSNKITIPVSKRRQESFNRFIKLKN